MNYPECPNCGKPIITHALSDEEKRLWEQFNLCGSCIGFHIGDKCCGNCKGNDCESCGADLLCWEEK